MYAVVFGTPIKINCALSLIDYIWDERTVTAICRDNLGDWALVTGNKRTSAWGMTVEVFQVRHFKTAAKMLDGLAKLHPELWAYVDLEQEGDHLFSFPTLGEAQAVSEEWRNRD